jgi:diaminopimelate decarboxylase
MSDRPRVRRVADWPAERLEAVADEYETPAYVIDLDRIRQNLDRVQSAFPEAAIHYAVKANAGSAVLETLATAGIGAECASAGEFERAVAAGFPTGRILYTPVNPPKRDLDSVLEYESDPLAITVGALDTVRRLADRDFAGDIAIRIHPGTGAGHSDSVATGADRKFGIAIDRVDQAVDLATEHGMTVVGVHAHAGSGILNPEDVRSHREVVETIAKIGTDLDQDIDFVDVGGGFGVPYRPAGEPLDLATLADSTRDALDSMSETLRIEPGRYLVADAGLLLTRVNTVKPAGEGVIAGVDAGMTDLLRPALYDASHPVAPVGSVTGREEQSVSVVGPICESTDVLAQNRRLPAPERGDLMAIGLTGAYGIEMASQYNSRPRPPVIAFDGATSREIRRREQFEDITAQETDR